MTSPGYGYTTATAKLIRGSSDYYLKGTTIALEVTLADNTAPVKLTKKGEGTLTVKAANKLPDDAVVSVEGGSLAGEGVTFSEYAADIAAGGAYGTIPSWPDGAVLSIANMDQLDPETTYTLVQFGTAPAAVPALKAGCELPTGWRLKLRDNKLVLVKARGMVVIIR